MSIVRTHVRATVTSWRTQSPAVRIIRLWLGCTWIYAGWNKATDPGFLSKTGRTYIGQQLTGYSLHSPLGFLFRHMIERATFVGIVVTISEFAIGIATLLWIAPISTAFVGFAMSVGLWMAATWHVKPYFLASDTAYAVLWLAYFLTLVGKRRKVDLSLDRRGAMRLGGLGVVAIVATFFGNIFFKPSSATAGGLTASSTTSSSTTSSAATSANEIIKLSDLAVGQTHEFSTNQGPAILFRTKNGVFAYSEICTHQGCTVGYSPPDKVLFCPCHGAVYDPFNHAQVLQGPTSTPLSSIKVAISGDWVVLA